MHVALSEYFFLFHQSHILGFIRDIFDFNTSDYSSVESLCDSIVRLAKKRSEQLLKNNGYETDMTQTSFDEPLKWPKSCSELVSRKDGHSEFISFNFYCT